MVMSSSISGGGGRDVLVFQPDKGNSSKLQDFVKSSYEKARLVISERMPRKILELTELLKEKNEYGAFLETELTSQRSKRVKTMTTEEQSTTLELSNTFLLAESEFELLKKEVLELVDMASSVKLWLQLNVPRIEDGNNFGVSIQTDTVGELSRVEDAALMTVENWSKFLMLRAKIISKIYKHAGSSGHEVIGQSYRLTLESMDEKQLRSVWIGWMDLRNNYAIIYDLLIKNIEKLVNPRSINTSNMY